MHRQHYSQQTHPRIVLGSALFIFFNNNQSGVYEELPDDMNVAQIRTEQI